ncbi:hypothetical protein ACEOHC_003868 [Salmonella enterica]
MSIPVIQAPTCTCQRILWLNKHCEHFSLTIAGKAQISAELIDGIHYHTAAPIDELAAVVGNCFQFIWDHWEPTEGVKA